MKSLISPQPNPLNHMRLISGVTILGFTTIIPVAVLSILGILAPTNVFASPILHSILEGSLAVFGILFVFYAYHGYKASGSLRLLLIAGGLLFASFFSIGHSLFQYTPIEWQRAFWYGRAAQFFAAFILFLAGTLEERIISNIKRGETLVLTAVFITAGFGFLIWAIEYATRANLITAVTQADPTARFLQLASVVLLAASFIRFLHGAFIIRSNTTLMFSIGIFLLVMADLTFAITTSLYDGAFWMSHVWKVLAYLSFLSGILQAVQTAKMTGSPATNSRSAERVD